MGDPLAGSRVLVTRAAHQAQPLCQLLQTRGAIPIERPMIVVEPVVGEEERAVRAALEQAKRGQYDAIIYTSPNTVELLAKLIDGRTTPSDASLLASFPARAFAIGDATAARLRARGAKDVVTAAAATSEALLDTLLDSWPEGVAGKRLLLPQARQAREVLAEGLRDADAVVDALPLYDTVTARQAEPLPEEPLDWLTFTSPSAVRGFLAHYQAPEGALVACIGRVTCEAALAARMHVQVAPENPSLETMVEQMSQLARLTRATNAQR